MNGKFLFVNAIIIQERAVNRNDKAAKLLERTKGDYSIKINKH
jgi:hypothetical protein